MLRASLLLVMALGSVPAADRSTSQLSRDEAEARLALVLSMARERNDRDLVARVRLAQEQVGDVFAPDPAKAEAIIAGLETLFAIEPGRWRMAGRPVFHPTPAIVVGMGALEPRLRAALAAGDEATVRAVIGELAALLGDQAGLPDSRRPGVRATHAPFTPAAAIDRFLDGLLTHGDVVQACLDGEPLPDRPLRDYAALVLALCDARIAVLAERPDRIDVLDRIAGGACAILTTLQVTNGTFAVPDLRGKQAGPVDGPRPGWLAISGAAGEALIDAGPCGQALLRAGALYDRADWSAAGLRAAAWAAAQPACSSFSANALAVSLLTAAHAAGDSTALAAAAARFRIGVAPGQVVDGPQRGRWIDRRDARTAQHIVLLRAAHDVFAALDADSPDRALAAQIAARAVAALADEAQDVGVTVPALPEVLRHRALDPTPDPRLAEVIRLHTAVCLADQASPRLAPELDDLAALSAVAQREPQR
ncbi:MAG: hypothetical protein H0W72_01205 [Planctomycetes bacterium]|nr:hypothetical protein [Planctomycetota bacterium]